MIKYLNLDTLMLHEKFQSRAAISEDTIAEYAESMSNGDDFPALTVIFDGVNYMLVDGYHRYHAYKKNGRAGCDCEVTHGTFRDAVTYALKANYKHGMRRTVADKRKSVMTCLDDEEYKLLSSRDIAKLCHVSHTFVDKIKSSIGEAPKEKHKKVGGEPKPVREEQAVKPDTPEPEMPEPENDAMKDEAVTMLLQENEALKDRLAVAAIDATEQEKRMAEETIADLRAEVRSLKAELVAVKSSRDTYQTENAQLKRQIKMLQSKLKNS